jgi:hypothetical protein
MAESIFDDKSKTPTSSELDNALGESAALLREIEQNFSEQFGEIIREWKFYGKKAGWTLALLSKNRRILHVIPRAGLFTVVFTLGKQAVLVSQASDLPEKILTAIENARDYAEGRSIRFDVSSADDANLVRQLAFIKMSN